MEVSNITKETFKRMFAEGKRFDGRASLEQRDFHIEFGVSEKAEGSARVRLGKTEVVAGVKLQVGTPYPDSLDKGNLMVSGDLLPLASPKFEMGPPGFTAVELPRLVDRAIRESGVINLKQLVIKEGELVWTVIIDIYPINDDGGLIDAASIAALAALKNTKMPALEDNKPDYSNKTSQSLPLVEETNPLSFSFFKIGDHLVLDPTREEEEAADTRITFGISKWNGQYMLNSCQKAELATFKTEEIIKIMDEIKKRYDIAITKLKKFL